MSADESVRFWLISTVYTDVMNIRLQAKIYLQASWGSFSKDKFTLYENVNERTTNEVILPCS